MKKLLTTAVIVAMATSSALANNNSFSWVGKTDGIDSGCFFTETRDGEMAMGTSKSGKITYWYTTDPAEMKIMVRQSGDPQKAKIKRITIEPVNSDGTTLGGSVWRRDSEGKLQEFEATVNYRTDLATGTQVVDMPTGWVLDYEKTVTLDERITLSASSTQPVKSGIVELYVGGTAVHVNRSSEAQIDADVEYTVSHLTTCLQ
jgi:ABC-type glycerol-3-phosphate transport system substrate-binding protein